MSIDASPTFTIALRGYDKEQVDHYLESLTERTSEADNEVFDLQEQARFLETEHQRQQARIDELEGAIRNETPHTVAALGQRITLILTEAEEGAADTVSQAEARAEYLIGEAELGAEKLRQQAAAAEAEARETLVAAQRQAEVLAERIEAEARTKATAIGNDAELRARRRHDQIESWAQEVIANTQSEQAQMIEDFGKVRRQHEGQLQALLGERDDAIAALRSLQGSLARAVERVMPEPTRRSAPRAEIAAERASSPALPAAGESSETDEPAGAPAPTRLTWADGRSEADTATSDVVHRAG